MEVMERNSARFVVILSSFVLPNFINILPMTIEILMIEFDRLKSYVNMVSGA